MKRVPVGIHEDADLGVAEGIGFLTGDLTIGFYILEVDGYGIDFVVVGIFPVVDAKVQHSSVVVVTELVHEGIRMLILCVIDCFGIEHHPVVMGQQG